MESNEILGTLYLLLGGFFILMVTMGVGIYALNHSRKRVLQAERAKAQLAVQEKSMMLRATIEGSERERRKIAEELHDQINAQLTVVRMAMARKDNPNLDSAIGALDDTIQDLRGMSRELMPPILERFGLLDALDDLFNRIESQTALRIEFEAPEDWTVRNEKRDLALYRIAQEFIQNTLKYADAGQVTVLIRVGDTIDLEMKDDGNGYDPENNTPGIGTRNIMSRAEYLNAEVELNSMPGDGVYLKLRVPQENKL